MAIPHTTAALIVSIPRLVTVVVLGIAAGTAAHLWSSRRHATPDASPPVVTPVTAPVTPSVTPRLRKPKAQKPPPPSLAPSVQTRAAEGDRATMMQLVIPVKGIRSNELRDTYNDARGAGRRHDAIDIMAAHNTPVLAAAPARVVRRDNGARGGIALYAMAADNRTIYYYAHLDRYAPGIVEGTQLRAGDVVGYVGDTGNAGAGNYHLHFEITTTADPKRYWGGASHNPYPLLRTGITQ